MHDPSSRGPCSGNSSPISENAVSTRTDQATGDNQHNSKDDLALDELNNSDDDQDRGDDPQDSCTHFSIPSPSMARGNARFNTDLTGRPLAMLQTHAVGPSHQSR